MSLNLRDEQLKIITHIYRLLYIKLMVTRNQKSVIDRQAKKTEDSKHSTKGSHQIAKEENKRRKGKKRTTKTTPRQLTKWQ